MEVTGLKSNELVVPTCWCSPSSSCSGYIPCYVV